jgi:hypothetical protein
MTIVRVTSVVWILLTNLGLLIFLSAIVKVGSTRRDSVRVREVKMVSAVGTMSACLDPAEVIVLEIQ